MPVAAGSAFVLKSSFYSLKRLALINCCRSTRGKHLAVLCFSRCHVAENIAYRYIAMQLVSCEYVAMVCCLQRKQPLFLNVARLQMHEQRAGVSLTQHRSGLWSSCVVALPDSLAIQVWAAAGLGASCYLVFTSLGAEVSAE